MLVIITTTINGVWFSTDEYCETHGRAMAQRLKARWPLPHEHTARTVDERLSRRTVHEVRVLSGATDNCEDCAEAAREGSRMCVHGATPLGQVCPGCDPLRR